LATFIERIVSTKECAMKWTYLTTAPDQLTAEIWIDVLHSAGLDARINPSDVASYLGIATRGCRILVPEDQRAGAEQCLREQGFWPDEPA
jgi:hypothetical protein